MIKVGDRIKALDFPGRDDCFMIGTVLSVKGTEIKCKTERTFFAGIERENSFTFTTHAEGCHFLDKHYPGRITLILEA